MGRLEAVHLCEQHGKEMTLFLACTTAFVAVSFQAWTARLSAAAVSCSLANVICLPAPLGTQRDVIQSGDYASSAGSEHHGAGPRIRYCRNSWKYVSEISEV